ncbi:hypothetical protein ACS0TY_000414 [Phlomoides rotata]
MVSLGPAVGQGLSSPGHWVPHLGGRPGFDSLWERIGDIRWLGDIGEIRETYWLLVEVMGTSSSSTLTAVLAKNSVDLNGLHYPIWNRNERELLSSQNQLLSLLKYPSMVKVALLTVHTSQNQLLSL